MLMVLRDDDGSLVMIPHARNTTFYLGKELINVFSPDVVILFDVGAGDMMKATLAQRVLIVGIVPNKAHRDVVMDVLRKYVEGLNLVNLADGAPSKPMAMIKFETQHPDNDDVKKSKLMGPGMMAKVQAD